MVDYLYDLENRWIGKRVDTDGDGVFDSQEGYVYDGNQMVLRFEGDDLSNRYLWQPDAVDQLMADEQIADEVVLTLTDHLGTVRDMTVYDDESSETTVVNHITYDSYGQKLSETNAAVDCLFGFTGRAFDDETGLQNNLNRWYDSNTGRWLSKDPIGFEGRDANTYRYVDNSPTNGSDPNGLNPLIDKLKKIFSVPQELIHQSVAAAVNNTIAFKIRKDLDAGIPPSIENLVVVIPVGSLSGVPITTTASLTETSVVLDGSRKYYNVHWKLSVKVSLGETNLDTSWIASVQKTLKDTVNVGKDLLDKALQGLLHLKPKPPGTPTNPHFGDEEVNGSMDLDLMLGEKSIANFSLIHVSPNDTKVAWNFDLNNVVKDTLKAILQGVENTLNPSQLPKLFPNLGKLKKMKITDLFKKAEIKMPLTAKYGINVTYDGKYYE